MDKAHTFTPGPWAVEGITRAGGKTSAIISYGVNCYGDGPEGYVCEARGVTLKDARLIAAAPELLQVANKAFDFLGGVDGAAEIRAELLSAIAKATQP